MIFMFFDKGISFELKCLISMILLITWLFTLYVWYLLMIFVSWGYMSFYYYLSVDDRVIFIFSWIHSCFIPYLKDFVLIYKIIIKLVRILQIGRVFKPVEIFSSPIFENLYQPKGGWIGDHALYAQIENLFNMCMNRVVGMSYTLEPHYIFN